MKRGAIVLGGEDLHVFVTSSRSELVQGLRGVRGLPPGMDGLLMSFRGSRAPRQLTMMGVLIDLDAYALTFDGRAGGEVVDEAQMRAGSSHSYHLRTCNLVLELPAGRLHGSQLGVLWWT